ncbi:MAG TPA: hypothetical protein VFV28_05575 [Limnobacter sp.]|nr:hypothetical protein [Limnobacter sp.]
MPANPQRPEFNEFPNSVNYDFVTTPVMSLSARHLQDPVLQMALRDAIRSRQGVFQWVRDGLSSLRDELQASLGADQAVALGEGVLVHGFERMGDLNGVDLWTLLVSAPAQDQPGEVDTFQVPFSEVNVPQAQLADPSAWVERSELAWHNHLFNVDVAYQDSVNNPLMLTAGCEQLSNLHALNIEISSRIQNGLVGNQALLGQTLQQLKSQFLGAEPSRHSVRVEGWLEQHLANGVSKAAVPVQSAIAVKRHLPAEEPPPRQVSVGMSLPDTSLTHALTVASLPDLLPPVENNLELTLAEKAPLCQPSRSLAYRQSQMANHCGVASVNAFFQAEVMSSLQAINAILDQHQEVWCQPDRRLQDLNLPGLYHPRIIDALRSGKSVSISQDEFLGQGGLADARDYEAMFPQTPAEQWGALLNYDPRVADMSDSDYRAFRDSTKVVSISPDLWLSAATGIHADSLESIVNRFLGTKEGNQAWADYPDTVERISMAVSDHPRYFDLLEDRILSKIHSRTVPGNSSFPMICMVPGHYFALARDSEGNWLKLDSNGTQTTGLQGTDLFAKAGELGAALKANRAIHVICEPL